MEAISEESEGGYSNNMWNMELTLILGQNGY